MPTKASPSLSNEQLMDVLPLIKGADAVELKLQRAGHRPSIGRRGARHGCGRRADSPSRLLRHPRPHAQREWTSWCGLAGPAQARRFRRQIATRRSERIVGEATQVTGVWGRGRRHARWFRVLRFDEGRCRGGRSERDLCRSATVEQIVHEEQLDFYADHAPHGLSIDRPVDARTDQRHEAQVHAQGLRPQSGRRAVDLPRRCADPRALDEMRSGRRVRSRRRRRRRISPRTAARLSSSSRPRRERPCSSSPGCSSQLRRTGASDKYDRRRSARPSARSHNRLHSAT